LAKALFLGSVMAPAEPNTSTSRLNTSEFPAPVVHETRRHHRLRTIQLATAGQLTLDQRGRDGLAEPHLIGDEVALRGCRRDAVSQNHLMGSRSIFAAVNADTLTITGSAWAS
jgi:hypothetical protein